MKTNTKKKSLFASMNPFLKGYKLLLIIAVIGSIISAVITVYGPEVLSDITDMVTAGLMGNMDLDGISEKAFMVAMLYGVSALIGYTQSYMVATTVQRFSQRLRTAISEKINRVPLNYFDSHKQGDTLSRVTNDVDTMGQSLNQSVGTMITSSTLLVGSIVMMFHTNWLLALTAIGSVLFGFILVGVLMGSSQRFFKQQQTNLANLSGFVEETYTGHNVITSYNAIDESKGQFETYNKALYGSMWKSQFISGIMMPMMGFIGNFGYVMVAFVGAVLTINGEVTIGTIVAFITYVRIFTNPLSQMAQALTQWQSASAAMSRVFEFLDETEMEDDSHKVQQITKNLGRVEFDHVNFGYLPGQTIINDFSAEAKPGQKVAIVGPTGAGKTTIVNLLMKFYEVNSGHIFIDGVDTRDMSRAEVHDQFSMVLQDTWLFEGTVMDNLIYNQEHVNSEQAVEAAKAVGVHHFIMTLPKGYHTVLDDTVTLSAGQKQLLTIARALLKESPLLILDEATSSVDTRTEELLQKAMDKLMEGRTSFVIAHRLSTIRNADLILVMKDGNIIEQGNHDELMAQAGFYADLYNSQFTEEDEDVA